MCLALAVLAVWKAVICQRKISVINHPQTKLVQLGKPANLSCDFSTDVQCLWYRDGRLFSDRPRVNWTSTLNKNNGTTTCTINFQNITSLDIGKWKCGTPDADSNVEIAYSREVLLVERTKPLILWHGKEVQRLDQSLAISDTGAMNLTCLSKFQRVQTTIQWHYRNKYFGNTTNAILLWDSSISLKDLSRTETSTLRCETWLQDLVEYSSLHFTCDENNEITTAPVVMWDGKPTLQILSSQLSKANNSLTCSKSGRSTLNLYWKLDGKVLEGSRHNNQTFNGCHYGIIKWNSSIDWRNFTTGSQLNISCIATYTRLTQTSANILVVYDARPMTLEFIVAISVGSILMIILAMTIIYYFRKNGKNKNIGPVYGNSVIILARENSTEVYTESDYANQQILQGVSTNSYRDSTNSHTSQCPSMVNTLVLDGHNLQSDRDDEELQNSLRSYMQKMSENIKAIKERHTYEMLHSSNNTPHRDRINCSSFQQFPSQNDETDGEGYLKPLNTHDEKMPASVRLIKERQTYENFVPQ